LRSWKGSVTSGPMKMPSFILASALYGNFCIKYLNPSRSQKF
jgi:hypothetical protein